MPRITIDSILEATAILLQNISPAHQIQTNTHPGINPSPQKLDIERSCVTDPFALIYAFLMIILAPNKTAKVHDLKQEPETRNQKSETRNHEPYSCENSRRHVLSTK